MNPKQYCHKLLFKGPEKEFFLSCLSMHHAWLTCKEPMWLLWMADRAGLRKGRYPQKNVVSACLDLAELLIPNLLSGQDDARYALNLAKNSSSYIELETLNDVWNKFSEHYLNTGKDSEEKVNSYISGHSISLAIEAIARDEVKISSVYLIDIISETLELIPSDLSCTIIRKYLESPFVKNP